MLTNGLNFRLKSFIFHFRAPQPLDYQTGIDTRMLKKGTYSHKYAFEIQAVDTFHIKALVGVLCGGPKKSPRTFI